MNNTRMSAARPVLRVLAVLLTLPLTGCIALFAAAAVGTVGYVQYEANEAFQDFEIDLEQVWDAAITVLRSQGHELADDYPHASDGGVIHLEAEGVWVKVERTDQEFTRVRVRIDTFDTPDHRERATVLLVAIDEELR